MSQISLFRKTAGLLAVASLGFLPLNALAQGAAKADIETPTFDDLPSPQINSGSKEKSFRPKDWLEVEAKLKLQLKPTPHSKSIDQITVKWYVAVQNPDGKGFFLITKDINHINVPLEEDVYVSAYLSPSTIRRLTGQDKAGKRSVDRVGIEVMYNGVKIAEASTKDKPGWWNAPSLARTDKFPLLSKNETPFAALWWDRYAEIQEERR